MEICHDDGKLSLKSKAGAVVHLSGVSPHHAALLLDDINGATPVTKLASLSGADLAELRTLLSARLEDRMTVWECYLKLVESIPLSHAVCIMDGCTLIDVAAHETEEGARSFASSHPGAIRTTPTPYKLWYLGRDNISLVSEHATLEGASLAKEKANIVLRLSGPHA